MKIDTATKIRFNLHGQALDQSTSSWKRLSLLMIVSLTGQRNILFLNNEGVLKVTITLTLVGIQLGVINTI